MKIYGLRIDYSIMAQFEDGGDLEEVGFGGTTGGASLAECAHDISSNLQNDIWESTGEHVDPLELLEAMYALKSGFGGAGNE